MPLIIKLNVMSGAMDESPPCYILQVDDAKIMFDCGWDEHFNMEYIKEISKQAEKVDAVFLSYPDREHLGALPYLVSKCGLKCPIYATIPVQQMGLLFMYDLYQSIINDQEFNLFNLDDVDAAFHKISKLKYNQTVALRGKCYGLKAVGISAGHMIGGTIWKIMKGEENIIYAVDFNHQKERHLNRGTFGRIKQPSVLITNSYNSIFQQKTRKSRDEDLLTQILITFQKEGNVLIATDTAGRVLELAYMLDQLWGKRQSGLKRYSLCLLNNVSYSVIKFAQSQTEWMNDHLTKASESVSYNPFQLKYTKRCHCLEDIYKISASKVVLASMSDLECGYGRNLCLEWLNDSKNSVILTSRSRTGTLARTLIDLGKNQRRIHVTVNERQKLSGEELTKYLKIRNKKSAIEISDTESTDPDEVLSEMNIVRSHDFVIDNRQYKRNKNRCAITRSFPMYPSESNKKTYDEYGQTIVPLDYIKDKNQEQKNITMTKRKKNKESNRDDVEESPTKCVSHEKNIEIKASVHFIPFEAKCDGVSLLHLICKVCPKTIVLVNAPPIETRILGNYLHSKTFSKIFTPFKGEVINISYIANMYPIKLSDELLSSIHMVKSNNGCEEIAWVDGIVERPFNIQIQNRSENMETEEATSIQNEEHDQIMVLRPYGNECDTQPQRTTNGGVFVNEIRLSDLKQAISQRGIDCEFSGGVLYCCNKTITIRRKWNGQILFTGTLLSDDYYKVRSILYDQFIIL